VIVEPSSPHRTEPLGPQGPLEHPENLYGITYGNSTFVVVGDNDSGSVGTILTSSDGITWTSRTSGTTNTLYGVTYSQ